MLCEPVFGMLSMEAMTTAGTESDEAAKHIGLGLCDPLFFPAVDLSDAVFPELALDRLWCSEPLHANRASRQMSAAPGTNCACGFGILSSLVDWLTCRGIRPERELRFFFTFVLLLGQGSIAVGAA